MTRNFGADKATGFLGITCSASASFPAFTVDIANVSLVGPAGVEPLLLEDFQNGEAWSNSVLVQDVNSDIGSKRQVNRVLCQKAKVQAVRRLTAQPPLPGSSGGSCAPICEPGAPCKPAGCLSRKKYTHIRYYWRLNGRFTDGNHTCPCQCLGSEYPTATAELFSPFRFTHVECEFGIKKCPFHF